MIKKITKVLIVLLLLILILPKKQVNAFNFNPISMPSNSGNEGTEDDSGDGTGYVPHGYTPPGQPKRSFICEYMPTGGNERKIDINAYDIEGNSVIAFSKITETKFKAGTWIGINLRELRGVSWGVGFKDHYERKWKVTFDMAPGWQLIETMIRVCSNPDAAYECQMLSRMCPTQHTSETFFWGDYEAAAAYAEGLHATYDSQNQEGWCTVNIGGPSEIAEQTTEYQDECRSEAVQRVISSVAGGISPTLQYNISDPNDIKNSRITNAGKYKEFKMDNTPSIAVCNNPLIELPFWIDSPSHQKTYMPVGGVGAIAGLVNEKNYLCFVSGSYYITYEYSPGKTCVNVKTSKITYKDATASCDAENEKELENGKTKDIYLNPSNEDEEVEYWHYFIPFNTPTSDVNDNSDNGKFYIRVESKNPEANGEEGSPDKCIEILKQYPVITGSNVPNYTDYIVAISSDGSPGPTFSGDYYGEGHSPEGNDIQIFKNGYMCKVSTKVEFNVEQHFYGENKEKKTLNGYSFYYRPIDPYKPFPNKIDGNSFWYDLYDEDSNSVIVKEKNASTAITTKLDESFNEVTYTTKNIPHREIKEAIRNDELNNNYTSWKNIDAQNGKSSFITELKLRITSRNFYKLGCGPANMDWEGCN